MGLASGGGGGGGGGGSFVWISRGGSFKDDDGDVLAYVIIGGLTFLLVGGLVAWALVDGNNTNKFIKEERIQLEQKLAEDANVEKFNLEYFDWITENNEYFFTFSGTAIKEEGKPIDFILSKYLVSEQNYYEIITYIEKEGIEGLDHKKGLLSKILDVVNESELVSSNQVTKVSNAVYDKESGEMVSIKGIKVPVINKENNTISYEVELMKFNNEKVDNTSLDFVSKTVTMPLTDKLERYPSLAYFADKEQCKVTTTQVGSIKLDGLINYIPINPQPSKTLKKAPVKQQLNAAQPVQGPELTPKMTPPTGK